MSAIVAGLGQHRLGIGAILNGHVAELILVGGEVGVAEIAEAVGIAGHAVHQRIVVGARLHVVALALGLADDRLGEELERARVVVGRIENDLPGGPRGVDVLPGLDLAPGCPDRFQLVDGERLDEVVLGVDDQRDPVVADQESRPLDALRLGLGFFIGLGRARGVDDVDFALRIALKPPPVPWLSTTTVISGSTLVERLLGGLADPEDRARAVDDDPVAG